ncbi:MAG: hypothetical protein ACM3JC_07275 [Rudaea sp.]
MTSSKCIRRPEFGAARGERRGLPVSVAEMIRPTGIAGTAAGLPSRRVALSCERRDLSTGEPRPHFALLLSFGVVVFGALDAALLVPPAAELLDDVSDELAGGVVDDDDDDDDGALVLGVEDIGEDVEVDGGVEGVVVDDDDDVEGDGVTTGGVVEVVVVDDSRLHPARPSTTPVQRTVINALFIAISKVDEGTFPHADLAETVPCTPRRERAMRAKITNQISAVVDRQQRISRREIASCAHAPPAICIGRT